MMAKLDAHMHVWSLARGDYDWLTPSLADIYRDFCLDDVWPDAQQAGVKRCILVQAAASAEETDYLLSLAANDDRIAGVVGWVDFEAGNAVGEIERRAAQQGLVGLRPMIADLPDPEWILQSRVAPALDTMSQTGLVLDGHARPDLVPVVTALASRYPALSIVLNHAGKPPISTGEVDTWLADITVLAACPNVSTKLSGLLTEAGARADDAAIGEIVAHLAACFGPRRVIWGSDWPVLTMAGTYQEWAGQSERLIARYFPGNEDAIRHANAARIYLGNSGGRLGQA
ncbi:amidohydrolase family protein [Hyphomonas sp.]|uniref:amidohydrolase family protein n=1 Tax=Hyphomonas sp. TaxID=87 RepID=UPI0032ED5661